MQPTRRTAATLAAAALAVAFAAGAQAISRVEAGVLTCKIGAGSGLIVASSKALDCRFEPASGKAERYLGTINKIGLDIGQTSGGQLVWAVLAPSRELPPGALAGRYAGLGAEASAGVGLGANALLGGFRKSVALQPLSVQSQRGVNLAVGIAGLTLDTAR